MTTFRENPNGSREWFVDLDALEGSSLLEANGAPELTPGEFSELVAPMMAVSLEAENRQGEDSSPEDSGGQRNPHVGQVHQDGSHVGASGSA